MILHKQASENPDEEVRSRQEATTILDDYDREEEKHQGKGRDVKKRGRAQENINNTTN